MPTRRLLYFTGYLLLTFATAAFAEDAPNSQVIQESRAGEFNQVLYKGLVGNVLDAVPMDPTHRVNLQRTNAVVSSTLSGHSLSVLAKLTNPWLLIGGVVWGLWAASNIKPVATTTSVSTPTEPASAQEEGAPDTNANEETLLTVTTRSAPSDFKPAPIAVHVSAESTTRVLPRSPVIRIWLSQPAN